MKTHSFGMFLRFACLVASLLIADAAPTKATSISAPESAPYQATRKTRSARISGARLTWTPPAAATTTLVKATPLGLLAVEKTETVTKGASSVVVQYYEENDSPAPSTSYITPPAPWARPTGKTEVAAEAAAAAGAQQDDPIARKWVDLHNSARAPFGAGKLEWKADLVARARANAILCTGNHTNAGENIAAQSGDLSPELTVKWWMAEEVFYDWSRPEFKDKTGHFTQAIWANSRYVGCYTTACAAGTVFEPGFGTSYQSTCEYEPAGNYVNAGEFEKNVGKRQSGSMPWLP